MGLLGFINIPILEDMIAFFITLIAILLLIKINDRLRNSGKLNINISRKVIHTFSAPIFLFFFPFYSGSWYSPLIGAIVPLIFALKFLTIGLGLTKDETFVNTMSRTGDPRELLRGTFYYTLVMIFVSLFWWTHPLAVVAFSILAFGDGFADIIGRKYGKRKIRVPAGNKTLEGSLIGMFFMGLIFTALMVFFYGIMGAEIIHYGTVVYTYTINSVVEWVVPLIILAFVGMIVELYSPKDIDNIIIPMVIIIVGIALILSGLWPGINMVFQPFWSL
ncbi:phosphatidate cytidylyltransferase [Euryarchaeota archaeon ex4484_178]|nr:MAG: phosphatidate cytidylyltransferase [Euryarchaeota archaeon ex4484_178]